LFTLISAGAAAALFLEVLFSAPSEQATGVFFLICAPVCYAAAEVAASQARLYRYGIEEALAVCSVIFLCAGMQFAFFSGSLSSARPDAAQFLVPAAGAALSLWIWRRFGLSYAFLAAMIFVIFLPGNWTESREAQHVIVALFYATGLVAVAKARSRHRLDYLDEPYSLVEALLWLGIYLTITLQLLSLDLPARWQWASGIRSAPEFARPFYWTTWILIWCLPPIVLARHSPEGSLRHSGGRDHGRLDVRHQQTLPRLEAAYLGPDASRHFVNRSSSLHPTLASPWPRRNSPRLYRRAPFGKR
jgi:hypothetical protein